MNRYFILIYPSFILISHSLCHSGHGGQNFEERACVADFEPPPPSGDGRRRLTDYFLHLYRAFIYVSGIDDQVRLYITSEGSK